MANKHETLVEELCAILQKKGAFNASEAQSIKKLFRERSQAAFDDFLLEEGLVRKEDLLVALSEYYQVPSFDVTGYFFDHLLVTRFPKELLLNHAVIPLEIEDETVLIVIANEPDDPEILPDLGEYVSYDIQFMVGLRQNICDAVKEFYDVSLTMEPDDIDLREEHRVEQEEKEIEELEEENFEE